MPPQLGPTNRHMLQQIWNELRNNVAKSIALAVLAVAISAVVLFRDSVGKMITDAAHDAILSTVAAELEKPGSSLRAQIAASVSADLASDGSDLAKAFEAQTLGALAGTIGVSTQVSTILDENNPQHILPIFAPRNRRVYVLFDVVSIDSDNRAKAVYLRIDNSTTPIKLDVPDKSGIDITKFVTGARELKQTPPPGLEFISAAELSTKEFQNVFNLTFSLDRSEVSRPVHISAFVFVLDPVWMN